MADVSLIQDDAVDDSDEGVFEQGDGLSGEHVEGDSPFLRIKEYEQSTNIFDRQMVPRVLLELFKKSSPDALAQDLPQIMKIITRMSREDDIMVRTDLLEQIPNIAATAVQCKSRVPELGVILSDHLLPIIVHNLVDKDNQVRKTAHSSLFLLLEKNLVTRQQVEIQVCPTVLELSNSDTPMDYHPGSIMLMSRLVQFLGQEVTERVFLQRFSQLCTSNLFYVRKACAAHFGDFCAVIGKEAYDNILLPSYLNLCTDEIWGVRKACAEVIISVSCACSSTKRRSSLAPTFAKLLQDENRWVRLSAFQTLGPFISTFADPTITSLAYNNVGELVLVNSDGTEFRITPTYSESNVLRSVSELHMLFKEEANKNYPNVDELFDDIDLAISGDKANKSENQNLNEPQVDQNIFIDPNPTNESSNIENNINTVTNSKCDENVSQDDEIYDLFQGIDRMQLTLNFTLDYELPEFMSLPNSTINNSETESYDNVHQVDTATRETVQDKLEDNKSVDNNLSNQSDSIGNNEIKLESQNDNCIKDKLNIVSENLEDYNSYKYWYVSPEMPLDLSITDNEVVPTKEETVNNNIPNKESNLGKIKMEVQNHLNTSFKFPESSIEKHAENVNVTVTRRAEDEKLKIEEPIKAELPSQFIVPQVLIDHFISMTGPNLAQESNNEMAYHCAYSLPAVALTLGSENWHLLRHTVELLAANMQYKVRRTVASCLHELAMILGPEIATNSLTPIFEGFIKDLDEVRIGVLKHLAHFLRLINPVVRNIYLPRLAGFLQTDNEANWRFRQELAEQLLLAVPLFRPRDACKHISFLAQELLCDKVAAVREVALLLVTELIRHVSSDQGRTSRLLLKLDEKFAHSKRWKFRQSFALLCSEMLTSQALTPEQFAVDVMPHFLDLGWDPVPNVRLVVARTIAQHVVTNEYFSNPNNPFYGGVQAVLRRLQSDKDSDVRDCAVFHRVTDVQ